MGHKLLSVLLLGLVLALGHVACGGDGDGDVDTDVDADSDTDADTDADVDADTDADTDVDADGDTDVDGDADADGDGGTDASADADEDGGGCAALPDGCCDETCPCDGASDDCVYPEGLGLRGVCKRGAGGAHNCWQNADCGYGEHCAGAVICPCEHDCLVPDAPGTCSPVAGACCGDGVACPAGFFCMELGAEDTCHAELTTPGCWSDADCPGGSCEGATICSCLVDCLSQPGTCRY